MRTRASALAMPSPAARLPASPGRSSRAAALVAAAVAHAAALALLVVAVRPEGPTALRPPVPLAAPVPIASAAPGLPAWVGKPVIRPLAALSRRASAGVPVARRVPVATALAVRTLLAADGIARSFREGTAPADSAAGTEAALRQEALREATVRWNAAFAGLMPEVRAEMFLEALENSPFPRR